MNFTHIAILDVQKIKASLRMTGALCLELPCGWKMGAVINHKFLTRQVIVVSHVPGIELLVNALSIVIVHLG